MENSADPDQLNPKSADNLDLHCISKLSMVRFNSAKNCRMEHATQLNLLFACWLILHVFLFFKIFFSKKFF